MVRELKGEEEKEEGTRIWPLQLEERGKAGVANPCKEPLYFPKEMLRAPDVLSSLVRKIAGPVACPLVSFLVALV